MNKIYFFLLMIVVGALVACAGSGEDSNGIEVEDAIIGSWFLDCFNGRSGFYEFTEIQYLGNTVYYENEDCSGEVILEITFDVIYSLGEETISTDGVEATTIDIDFDRETVLGLVFIEDDRLYFGIDSEEGVRSTGIEFSGFLQRI